MTNSFVEAEDDDSNIVELPARWEHAAPRHHRAGGARALRDATSPRSSRALGMDLDTPGTRDTPRRFLQALLDATAGYDGDPKLRTAFPSERPDGVAGTHSQIVEGPIGFFALCEHHALPFHGVAHIAYVAGRRDPRDLEADAARAPLRAALHGAGAPRRGDRRRARVARRPARGRRAPRGGASLHADARRQRGALAHRDDVLARRSTTRTPTCGASSSTRCAPGATREHRAAQRARRAGRAAAARAAGGAAAALRRRARLRRAARVRQLRRDDRRRRRDAGHRAVERDRLRRERGRPLRDGAPARASPTWSSSARARCSPSPKGTLACRQGLPCGGRRVRGATTQRWARASIPPSRSSPRAASFDPTHPVLETGAIVLTTERAAADIRASVPATTEVVAVNDGDWVDPAAALAALRARGHDRVLSEGGPTLFDVARSPPGSSTSSSSRCRRCSPAARACRASRSPTARSCFPTCASPVTCMSIRRHGDHLFLRYALASTSRRA